MGAVDRRRPYFNDRYDFEGNNCSCAHWIIVDWSIAYKRID